MMIMPLEVCLGIDMGVWLIIYKHNTRFTSWFNHVNMLGIFCTWE